MWLGKKATKIFVASDGMEKFFPSAKIQITGNPVRRNILQSNISREEAVQFFGLDVSKKTILATGGSLGARGINEAIFENIDAFKKADVQLIWQTGKPFVEKATSLAVENKNIWVNSFIAQME